MSGGFARALAVLLTALALSGCIEGGDEPAHTHGDCPEEHAMEHSDDGDATQSEEAADEEPTNETLQLMQARQQGNDTGSENETELPEDNDHGAMAESGHHEECPGDEADLDSATTSDEEIRRSVQLSGDVTDGGAPMTVSFTGTINADAYTADNESFPVEAGEYTWTISFTSDGPEATGDHSAPIAANHTYEVVGEFEATLTVTFADDEQLTDALPISVVSGEPAGKPSGAFVKEEVYSHAGILPAGVQGLNCGTGNQAADGVTEAWHTWTFTGEEEDGTPTIIDGVQIDVTYDPPGLDLDVDFLAPDGTVLGGSHDFNALAQRWSEHITIEGKLSPGDYTIYVVSCGGPISYEISGLATYIVA